METNKRIVIGIGTAILVIGGWALFRPELLFVNQRVNDKAPAESAAQVQTLAKGAFASYAHESAGMAVVLKTQDKTVLRLENFKTSNGPDVHVYLVKGNDVTQDGVNKNGFYDLGTLKGNIGDQNYDLPAGFDLKTYGGVSIWCKRFGVAFAGASFDPRMASLAPQSVTLRLASYAPAMSSEIKVTSGKLEGKASGTAELIEADGKRFVRIRGLKVQSRGLTVLLVKAEDAKTSAEVAKASQIILGKAVNGTVSFPIDEKVDAWLYRTVSIWDGKTHQSLAVAHLRSDQERVHTLFI